MEALDTQEYFMTKIKAKITFKVMQQLIQQLYVSSTQGINSIPRQLTNTKQRQYNHTTRPVTFLSVDELFQKYQTIINEIDSKNPLTNLPNLANSFYETLFTPVKEKEYNETISTTTTP